VTEPLDVPTGWTVVAGRLHRELTFADFDDAFAFMTRVADEARRLDHHPDWCNSWNTVVIDIVDHSSGGITERCIALARAIDAVVTV
jgi:4a-hydroxytetrahydrobiopterin dehydratase